METGRKEPNDDGPNESDGAPNVLAYHLAGAKEHPGGFAELLNAHSPGNLWWTPRP